KPEPVRSVETAKAAEPASSAEKPSAAAKPADPRVDVAEPRPVPPATIPARETANARPADPSAPVVVDVRRQGEALRLTFPFATPTPAAVCRRADTIWLVFDSQARIDIGAVAAQSGRTIRGASVSRSRDGQVVQLKLDRPKLTSVGADGPTWTVTVGDM